MGESHYLMVGAKWFTDMDPAKGTEILVRKVLQGDQGSFAALYDRFAPAVRAVCWGELGRVGDAQDLTQEVFLRVYRKLGELKNFERFGPWVVAIARRTCLERKRAERRWNSRREFRLSETTIVTSPSDEEFEFLHRALSKLDDEERTALELFYLKDHHAEFARDILGLSRSGFYKLLERARCTLKKHLEVHDDREIGRPIH